MKTNLLFVLLLLSGTVFSQNHPCVKAAIIGTYSATQRGTVAAMKVCPEDYTKLNAANKNNITLYPNPANTYLSIVSPSVGIKNIRVNGLTGNNLFSKAYTENPRGETVDVSLYPAGMYIISIQLMNNTIIYKKVIKL